jgi:hypothetical protein
MDARLHDNRLNVTRERLLQSAARSKPSRIIALEAQLHEISEKLYAIRPGYAVECYAATTRSDNRPSAEWKLLDAEIKRLEQQRDTIKSRLRDERGRWAPELKRVTAPHLDEANAALTRALALVEAASAVHSAADQFTAANAIADANLFRGRRLEAIAQTVKRFLGVK